MDDGDSVFTFDRSGPFYFISGNKSNCDKGQKLTVVVLSLRNRSPSTTGAGAPTPATTPANPSPGMAPTPGEGYSPISSSPSMTPGSPMASSPGSLAPRGGTAADSNGPPPLGSYAPAAITPSSVFWVSSVSFALSVAMGSFINSH